jgi:hypothetical protein
MLFFGALLCSAGSPGAGSPTSQLVLRAPTSRRPAGLISLAVPFLSATGASRLHPRFLGNPWIRAVVRDPGEPDATVPVDPVALRVGIGLQREEASRRSRFGHFGALRHGPHPRCPTLRGHGRPCTADDHAKTRFRREGTSLLVGGTLTRGYISKFQVLPPFVFDQACPGALFTAPTGPATGRREIFF